MSEENLDNIVKDAKRRMKKSVEELHQAFSLIRSGRATPGLVEDIRVEVYGQMMPLNQVASITIPEARQIVLDVWDKGNVQAVEKAILTSGRNFNPQNDGQYIRIVLPDLTEERRKEFVKMAKQKCEEHKIAIRNIRRDANDSCKKMEGMSEDTVKNYLDQIQKLTDGFIDEMDKGLEAKELEILTV